VLLVQIVLPVMFDLSCYTVATESSLININLYKLKICFSKNQIVLSYYRMVWRLHT